MQGQARRWGIDLAPHGKTTMSPQLFRRQLDAGAWGLTFATVTQLRGRRRRRRAPHADRQPGAQRRRPRRRSSAAARAHPGLRVVVPGRLAGAAGADRRLVQRHAGSPAVRGDARDRRRPGGAHRLPHARARRSRWRARLHASEAVQLVGIECYEGLGAKGDSADDAAYAAALMDRVERDRTPLRRRTASSTATRCCSRPAARRSSTSSRRGSARARPPGARPAALGLLRDARPGQLQALRQRASSARLRLRAGREPAAGARGLGARCSRAPSRGSRSWRSASATSRSTSSCRCRSRARARGARRPARCPASWKITGLNDQHALPALGRGGRSARAGGGRARRPGHLAPLHDLRQVALDADGRARLPRRSTRSVMLF